MIMMGDIISLTQDSFEKMFQAVLSLSVLSVVSSHNMISTCSQQDDTGWNTQHVEVHLRSWLKSVTNLREIQFNFYRNKLGFTPMTRS